MTTLKPCPFCGGEAVLHGYEDDCTRNLWVVHCASCHVEVCDKSQEDVAARWNKRPPQTTARPDHWGCEMCQTKENLALDKLGQLCCAQRNALRKMVKIAERAIREEVQP